MADKKKKQINVWVSEELSSDLDAIASRYNLSKGGLIQIAILSPDVYSAILKDAKVPLSRT